MSRIELAPGAGHALPVISSLLDCGWTALFVPPRGRLPRNNLLLTLETSDGTRRFRLLIYKVTESSRQRESERRIEITSTYRGALTPEKGYEDIVLGFDAGHDLFIGVDPIRLEHGGATTNASSFLDLDGLLWKHPSQIQVRARPTVLRPEGVEYQAYFKPSCLADYLMNSDAIHAGSFEGPMYFARRYRQHDRYAGAIVTADEGELRMVTLRAPRKKMTRPSVTNVGFHHHGTPVFQNHSPPGPSPRDGWKVAYAASGCPDRSLGLSRGR